MKKTARHRLIVAFVVATLAGWAPAAVAAQDAPIRHLVYSFTVGIQTTLTIHDSGFGVATEPGGPPGAPSDPGVNDLRGGTSDEGTIVVDVTQQAADGGLVVNISEVAKNQRTAKPALCAVYGYNLSVVCDATVKVNEEEIALLRVLGRNFVSAALDPHKHWQVDTSSPGYSEVNDFTIMRSDEHTMTIDEQRVGHLTGAGGFELSTNGTIVYDPGLTVATSLHELAVRRQNEGANDYRTTRTDSMFQLTSDSLAKVKP